MNKHTPGPWMVGAEGNGAVGSVYCDNSFGSRVAIAYGPEQAFSVLPREEEEANARLIAAAPDLLAVASELLREYEGDAYMACEELIARAHAAIAKATGEGSA